MLKIEPRLTLDYLVTGTGRCGTVYMARLLTSLGIRCTHEAIFNFQGLEAAKETLNLQRKLENSYCSNYDILNERKIDVWIELKGKIQAESSYMAAPFLDDDIFKSTKIIHVVRNPLKVISSYVKDMNFFDPHIKHNLWLDFILDNMPELNQIENSIERACYYYTNWNALIESKISSHKNMRHKVENKCSQSLLDFLEISDSSNAFLDSTINSWKRRTEDLTFNNIPDGSIKRSFIEMASRYEYI